MWSIVNQPETAAEVEDDITKINQQASIVYADGCEWQSTIFEYAKQYIYIKNRLRY